MLGGVLCGFLVGVLPGLGGAAGTALMIPISYGLDPVYGIAFIMSIAMSAGLGGQMSSILINVPGDPPNAATTLDGYPMTKQGRAAEALGAATCGSLGGAIIGVVLLVAVLPFAEDLVLAFSYPELCMIAVTGLVMISALTRGHVLKGLISAGTGLLIAFIGLDPITGGPRFTFDQLYLWDGIDIVPALVGLFAGAEMLSLFSRRGSATIVEASPDVTPSRLRDGLFATVRGWKTVVVSSLQGFVVGTIPGTGGTVSSFLSYSRAARMSRHPERFGKGAVEGVIAAETANDAGRGGELLPTIAFGIPGGTLMAVVLAGLLLHGVPVGPNLIREDEQMVYVLVVALLIPRVIASALALVIGARGIVLTRIRGDVLAPIITVIALVGVYAVRAEMLDVVVALVFGYVGYAMEAHGFSRVALVIALVLGGLVETSFHQTVETFGVTAFVTRPISLVLLIVSVLALVVPPLLSRRRSARARMRA